MLEANDPTLTSWVPVKPDSDFPIQNLPLGIYSTKENEKRIGVAIGDHIADLESMNSLGLLQEAGLPADLTFNISTLNPLLELGKPALRRLRNRVSALLSTANVQHRENIRLVAQEEVKLHLPVVATDYTDFYSSLEHAMNVGTMFRGRDNALMPNWRHMPIAYHGRSGSIVGTDVTVTRPSGQMNPSRHEHPEFGLTRKLDFELELAAVIAGGTSLGETVSTASADEYVAGFLLFNDWSARDIQAWEYQPLGPFLGKNFFSSVSPWLVLADALEPFRVEGPVQKPEVLTYLQVKGPGHYDINLQVDISSPNLMKFTLCQTNSAYLYWDIRQQIAHHTINGCNLNPGDMLASGTISGPVRESFGSMLELSWNGTQPVSLPDGTERTFLEDGDVITLSGYAQKDGIRVGFGSLTNEILSNPITIEHEKH
jgi:fumarylacetoacetase